MRDRVFIVMIWTLINPVFSFQTFGEGGARLIPQVVLANPIEYSCWIDSLFPTTEILRWDSVPNGNQVFLSNGYAQHSITNGQEWLSLTDSVIPHRIEVVFTKYPNDKDDWITNYYELLANRLIELFSLDSTLNSASIEWGLTLQTDCETGLIAEMLPHGIAIGYSPKLAKDLITIGSFNEEQVVDEDPNDPSASNVNSMDTVPYIDSDVLFPESILRRPEYQRPRRNRKDDTPPCPDLPARGR